MVSNNGQILKGFDQKIPPKPVPLRVIPENIPDVLKPMPNWVCWWYERVRNKRGESKWTKSPFQVMSRYARTNSPDTWLPFAPVYDHYLNPVGWTPDGIGFRPTGDIVAIDLDHCRDPHTGRIEDWAWGIIRLINSYTEVSPSGTGMRILCHGVLPTGRRKRGNVEMYDESSPKYLTITGHHVAGTPRTLERRQDEIERVHAEHLGGAMQVEATEPREEETTPERLVNLPAPRDLTVERVVNRAADAANGEKFMKLYNGDFEAAGYVSQSEADLAFVSKVAFWTGPDPELIDAVFRSSGLLRDKWDSKRGTRTYGEITIEKAMRHESYYDWAEREWDDDIHRICPTFDPDIFDDCPDERPAFEDEQVDPCLLLDGGITLPQQQRTSRRRRGLKLDEIFVLPPPIWQIDQHFATGSLVTLFGPSGVGKSFVALDYALCIATGRPYLDRYEAKRGPVLYVAGEGVSGLRNRVKAWLSYNKIETPPANLVIVPATFNLLEEGEADQVIEIAKDDLGQNPSLVVIDTLARNFGGGNENATQDMNRFITNLDRIKAELYCTLLVVHHTGKDSAKKERGNTALRGASDTMILLDETDKNDGIARGAAVFCEKQKDAPEFDRYVLRKHTVSLDDGQESLVLTPKDWVATEYQFLKPAIKELLRTLHARHGDRPFSFTQGHGDSGLTKGTYTDRLQTLERRRLITKTIDNRYRVTDEATRHLTLP